MLGFALNRLIYTEANSMELSPSWEVTTRSATEEFPNIS
jgi:hypothetical protein